MKRILGMFAQKLVVRKDECQKGCAWPTTKETAESDTLKLHKSLADLTIQDKAFALMDIGVEKRKWSQKRKSTKLNGKV